MIGSGSLYSVSLCRIHILTRIRVKDIDFDVNSASKQLNKFLYFCYHHIYI